MTVEDPSSPYASNAAPDKGAVGVFIPEMDLLVLNCHLHGTNKYDTPEEKFERVRIQQLHTIYNLVEELFGQEATDAQMVLFGDLNFRVEIHATPEDKARLGRDFQAVMEYLDAALNEGAALEPLYLKYDRLRRLMNSPACPPLLRGCDDLLAVSLRTPETQLLPTFTYKPKAFPRVHSDKRTPAWPDRILLKRINPQSLHLRDVQQIVVSDHSPVLASMEVSFEIRGRDTASECTTTMSTMSSASVEEIPKEVLIDTTVSSAGYWFCAFIMVILGVVMMFIFGAYPPTPANTLA